MNEENKIPEEPEKLKKNKNWPMWILAVLLIGAFVSTAIIGGAGNTQPSGSTNSGTGNSGADNNTGSGYNWPVQKDSPSSSVTTTDSSSSDSTSTYDSSSSGYSGSSDSSDSSSSSSSGPNGYDWMKMSGSEKYSLASRAVSNWRANGMTVDADASWFVDALDAFYGSEATNGQSIAEAMALCGVGGGVVYK